MLLYSRYIFNKTLINFAALTSILICLIWFSRAITFVKYVTENGVELSKFFYLFILILPWISLYIIPVSLFAGILITYNKLITNNEITILKSSGLTKAAICRPIISIAIIFTIFCFAISLFFMPYANKQLRISRTNLTHNYASLSFSPQTFETLNNITIYAQDRDENNNLLGILLHDERSSKNSVTITARTGRIVMESNSALLYMEDGTVQKLNPERGNKSDILNFDNYVFNLTETGKSVNHARWKAKERYLPELLNPGAESSAKDLRKYRTEIHQRFTYPLLPMIFSIIALSAILRGNFNRKGNSKNIAIAIFMASFFFGTLLSCYELIESNRQFTPILYLSIILFFMINLRMLKESYLKTKA